MTNLLQSMSGASNLIFGAVIGTLSIVDFGGPIMYVLLRKLAASDVSSS